MMVKNFANFAKTINLCNVARPRVKQVCWLPDVRNLGVGSCGGCTPTANKPVTDSTSWKPTGRKLAARRPSGRKSAGRRPRPRGHADSIRFAEQISGPAGPLFGRPGLRLADPDHRLACDPPPHPSTPSPNAREPLKWIHDIWFTSLNAHPGRVKCGAVCQCVVGGV